MITMSETKKFRENFKKNFIGFFICLVLFIGLIGVGVWDIVDPWILADIDHDNITVGIIMAIVGLLVPIVFPKIIGWDSEQRKDLFAFLFSFLFILLIIAAYIFLAEVTMALILYAWAGWLTLIVGIVFLVVSFILAPKQNKKSVHKARLGAFLMVLSNVLIIIAAYSLIGGALTI
jgi:uncharacterized membrane protein (DUF485 family)